MDGEVKRPIISDFVEPAEFVAEMIHYRRKSEASFSVARNSAKLRRISPTLISLIVRGKRRITLDRVEELSKLLNLSSSEKFYFHNWIGNKESGERKSLPEPKAQSLAKRKTVGTSILNDWINVYIKDLFQLPEMQEHPEKIYQQMASVATSSRVDKAIKFLLKEGHLRKTLDGRIVIDTNLTVTDPRVPSQKIRQFHKGALKLAQQAIDLYSPSERLANTLTLPLNEESYQELLSLINEFAEKLQDFAEKDAQSGDRLYQLLLNLSPVGGKQK